MDFDKLTFELDKLNLLQLDGENGEGDLNPETWLFTPEEKTTSGKKKDEEQNLEKWLKGAVDKVDYRTRSALSRKLEKKKRNKDKAKRRDNMESSLSMIEECSGESGPMSDREQQHQYKRPREKENMAQRKCISEASIDSNDDDDDEEEEGEEYFDAPSTPKKVLFAGRNPAAAAQQSPNRKNNNNFFARNGQTPSSSSSTAKKTLTLPKSVSKGMQLQKASSIDEADFPKEWRNLSDIERRAKEQEKELQMELMKTRRARLNNSSNNSGVSPRSRPGSASSSTSSVLSGGPTSNIVKGKAKGGTASSPHLATSKSVDFCSPTAIHTQNHAMAPDQCSMASSRSNDGSLADLSGASTTDQSTQFGAQPLNSRLPLPRRPTIPGKTGIPLPAPKRIVRKCSPTDSAPMNDDECF